MGKFIRFYIIGIEDNEGHLQDYSIKDFLLEIEKEFFLSDNRDQNKQFLFRGPENKIIRLFSYYHASNSDVIVIPFGKLKKGNIPYWVQNGSLEEVNEKLFDINSLAYDPLNHVVALTTNREGPNERAIGEYLTTFIPKERHWKVMIRPLFNSNGIEQVRNAQLVRSISLNLDLGGPLNTFFMETMVQNREQTLLSSLKNMMYSARDVGSKSFTLNLSIGSRKKEGTLALNDVLSLLNQLNFNVDVVKEVVVQYKDGTERPIETAKLKNDNSVISYQFSINRNQISPEYLLNNVQDAFIERRSRYRAERDEYLESAQTSGEDNFEIVIPFNPTDFYE